MCALCSPPCARGRAGRHTSRTNAPQYAAAAAAVVAASLHDVRPRLREAVGPADGRGRARWGSCLGGPSLTSQRVTSGPATSWVGTSSGSKLEVARLQPNLASRVSTAQQRAAAPRPSSKQDEARRVDARRPAAPNGHGVGCVFHARPETAKPKSIRSANRWRHAGRATDRLSGCESRAIVTPVHGISKSSESDVAGRLDQTHAQPCLPSISAHASANLQLRDEVFFSFFLLLAPPSKSPLSSPTTELSSVEKIFLAPFRAVRRLKEKERGSSAATLTSLPGSAVGRTRWALAIVCVLRCRYGGGPLPPAPQRALVSGWGIGRAVAVPSRVLDAVGEAGTEACGQRAASALLGWCAPRLHGRFTYMYFLIGDPRACTLSRGTREDGQRPWDSCWANFPTCGRAGLQQPPQRKPCRR